MSANFPKNVPLQKTNSKYNPIQNFRKFRIMTNKQKIETKPMKNHAKKTLAKKWRKM